MTARHQLRIGNRRLGRDRTPIDATPAPPIGETLQLARERKGVDLFRAERDTKIRLRYLSALEDGDYDELPAPVYTKGFLRNYAIYLGLDPEEVLDRWHDEMEVLRTATRVAVTPPPMPIVEPGGRRLTITPGMFVAGLVLLVVLAFVGYIGVQFMRFVETTPVSLTNPADRFSTISAESIVLEGTSGPGALITIRGSGDQPYNTTANDQGVWSREVPLARGSNDFTVVAKDPATGRDSSPLALTINVPLPDASPGASPSTAPPAPITISLNEPLTGFVSTDGNVTVSGSTTGTGITIASTYLGAPGSTPEPSPLPLSSASPAASASAPPLGPARDATINALGIFNESLSFEPGRWRLTITAYASGLESASQTVEITVQAPAPTGIQLLISVENRDSWVRIVADGVNVPGYAGKRLRAGEQHTVSATNEMCIRAGNAGVLHLTLNGTDIGFLGALGEVGNWIIRVGQNPEPTATPC